MGYLSIQNLYKNQLIMQFRECYALEKVHGTSAHVTLKKNKTPATVDGQPESVDIQVKFFSGGASHMMFVELFNIEDLKARFMQMPAETLTVYGEAYGGKMQGMKHTYGDKLQFIAFEVEREGRFLGVETADKITQDLGLEFVPYRRISTDIEALNAERDLPSRVAVRRGITTPQIAEGVVLRPPIEVGFDGGDGGNFGRIIAKHKREEFSERSSARDTKVDPQKAEVLVKAQAIAEEWVVPMRMEHVLDKLRGLMQRELGPEDTRLVIDAMVEDVVREAGDEIVASKEAIKAISTQAAKMFRKNQQQALEGSKS